MSRFNGGRFVRPTGRFGGGRFGAAPSIRYIGDPGTEPLEMPILYDGDTIADAFDAWTYDTANFEDASGEPVDYVIRGWSVDGEEIQWDTAAIDDLIMTVQTSAPSESFTLPCSNVGTFNATIDWGDGSTSAITAYNDADLAHTYAAAGTHTIRISGTLPSIFFNNTGDKAKLITVEQLGSVGLQVLNLYGCNMMTSFAAGYGDTSSLTTLSQFLRACNGLTSLNVSTMDTSNVTAFGSAFRSLGNRAVSLADWDITGAGASAFTSLMTSSSMSTADYDATLISWASQAGSIAAQTVDFGTSTYTAGGAAAAARGVLTGLGWTISDGGTA